MDSNRQLHRWRTSTALSFWGTMIQTAFAFISFSIILYVFYNLTDILCAGILPSMANMNLDYYEDRFMAIVGVAMICSLISFLGYIAYLVGICLFKKAQNSPDSESRAMKIMLTELIMPALLILLIVIVYNLGDVILQDLESIVSLVLLPWAGSLAAVIYLLIQFKSLSNESTWTDKARLGANDLKFSYVCMLWVQAIIIIGLLVIIMTVLSYKSKLEGLQYGSYGMNEVIGGINSLSKLVEELISVIRIEVLFICLVVFIYGIMLTIHRILGWRRIHNGVVADNDSEGTKVSVNKSGDKDGFYIVYEEDKIDIRKKRMLWGGIAVGVIAIIIGVCVIFFADNSPKYVKIHGTKAKTSTKAPTGLWVMDGGTYQTGYGEFNYNPKLDLHLEIPKMISTDLDDDVLSYGEMDFTTVNRIEQFIILSVKTLDNNRYVINSKDFNWDYESEDTLILDPYSNTIKLGMNSSDIYWPVPTKEIPDGILGEITGDNVNFRSGPGVNYPVVEIPHCGDEGIQGFMMGCGNKGERVIVCEEPSNPDWYRIAVNSNMSYYSYAWVSKDYCTPLTTTGFPRENPKELYVKVENECPYDDDLGCWEPNISAYFLFPDGQCVFINSNYMISFGDLRDGVIYLDSEYFVGFNQSNQQGLKANISRDNGFKLFVGSDSSIASRLGGETSDWDYIPDMFFFDSKEIKQLRNDAKQNIPYGEKNEIILVEDLNNYQLSSIEEL